METTKNADIIKYKPLKCFLEQVLKPSHPLGFSLKSIGEPSIGDFLNTKTQNQWGKNPYTWNVSILSLIGISTAITIINC